MTEQRKIDYDGLLHDAFRDAQRAVVRTVLTRVVEQGGLPGEHHFYIGFYTLAAGVSIAPRLLEKYPSEMTIVLQHRFWDLAVQADRFEVKLTFDGIRERLVVPFTALRMFFDPSVPYGFQFDDQADPRQPPLGEVMGFSGGRNSGRASGRTQGERGERPSTDGKKSARKTMNDASANSADGISAEDGTSSNERVGVSSPVAIGGAEDPAPLNVGPSESGTSKTDAPQPVARTGPRLVETANDSAKVISLDHFRKK